MTMPKSRAWILASRPPTLPAAFVPVLVGSALAVAHGHFRLGAFLAAFVSALFIQIGTNIANDLFDFQKGADTEERLGPTRVTQSGLLSISEVRAGMWVSFAVAFMTGLYLVYIGGWPILLVGVLGIICGIAYTGGPFPLAYHGLGDVFAFLFFGIIAVCGTYYVHTDTLHWLALWVSLPVAFLVNAILVVNNYRDIDTDRKANKRTLAVRMGPTLTRGHYFFLVAGAYVIPVIWSIQTGRAWVLLPLITLPLGIKMIRALFTRTGTALNPVLKGTGQLHLIYGIFWMIGIGLGTP